MKRKAGRAPRCVVIGGPNGAGKTTFARLFLTDAEGVVHFVNTDLIAAGLSPQRPELAAVAAGRVFLAEIDRLSRSRINFAFETTMSGLTHARRIAKLKSSGYQIDMIFLRLDKPETALTRVAFRVLRGGHDVPREDVLRRFERGWKNFEAIYRPLADTWALYDSSGDGPPILEEESL